MTKTRAKVTRNIRTSFSLLTLIGVLITTGCVTRNLVSSTSRSALIEPSSKSVHEIKEEEPRTVSFVPHFGAYYSAMWWQNRENFLSIPTERITFLEAASFAALRPGHKIRMTRDWLDLSVEHLSAYWKHFKKGKERHMLGPIEDILKTFIETVEPVETRDDTAPRSTIAIVPFSAKEDAWDINLRVRGLEVTLLSLWRIGIGRVVVVYMEKQEEKLVEKAFSVLKDKQTMIRQRPMEIASVWQKGGDKKLVPKVAIQSLQMAMKGELPDTRQWLGAEPSRWKYVYFTEPDQILHTRATSLPTLTAEMDQGSVLTAQRLDLIPYEKNFPNNTDLSIVVPAVGNFSTIHELDPSKDACCGVEGQFPGKQITQPACSSFWWQCGYRAKGRNYSDPATVMEMHSRKVPYPLVSFRTGTHVPLLHEHRRICLPVYGGQCRCKTQLNIVLIRKRHCSHTAWQT